MVLSIHSAISGVAVGLQSAEYSMFMLVAAIVAHKWIESFSVGASLIRMEISFKKFSILAVLYSFAEPLGVIIGIAVSESIQEERMTALIEAIAGSIAAGTFIYVASIDIMMEEFNQPKGRLVKALLCAIGYALMTALVYVFPHSHGEEGGDEDSHDHMVVVRSISW
eukprot:TRINITY_DN3250_c0_g1_i2.p1 TRINITY_DN3250_c0_g1~~TRINITY_DN3250_c0_g1_i2.p1  ORF type:complete len:167 (-),score=35.79 TRINITY_DN3250_c0_g1_i2:99-599(-)